MLMANRYFFFISTLNTFPFLREGGNEKNALSYHVIFRSRSVTTDTKNGGKRWVYDGFDGYDMQ